MGTYFTIHRLVGKRRSACVAGYKEDKEVQRPRQKDVVQQSEASTLIIAAAEHLPHSTVLWISHKQRLYPYHPQRGAQHTPPNLRVVAARVNLC